MEHVQNVITQTQKWINDVVIGCNFCPFAARVMKQQSVHYQVEDSTDLATCLNSFVQEMTRLDSESNLETSFVIFPNGFALFDDFLNLLEEAEYLLKQNGNTGIYQVASFHPQYSFSHSTENDAANYTNRSVYPMLHLLREASIEKVLFYYKNPEEIPEQNINFSRNKGLAYMKKLKDACFSI